jgi:hypothetical protein
MGENEMVSYSVIKLFGAYVNLSYVCRISLQPSSLECFVVAVSG